MDVRFFIIDSHDPAKPPPIDARPTRSHVGRGPWVLAALGAAVIIGHAVLGYRDTGSLEIELIVAIGTGVVLMAAFRFSGG